MKKTFFIILVLLLNTSSVFANDNNSWDRNFWQRATVEQIEDAFKNGADVNKPVKYGDTPLTLAIEKGDIEVIKALIKAGADVNAKGAYDELPIFNAIRKVSAPEITELLVDAGVDLNVKKNDQTPLDFAIDINSQENIEAIVKNSPSLRLKYSNKYWTETTFEDIKKDVQTYYKNENYKDFLYMAIKNGQGLDAIKLFANNDFSIKDATGKTLLMYTVENNQSPKVVQFLIDNGNDVNAQDKYGSYVIDYALAINPEIEELTINDNPGVVSGINRKKITSTAILEVLIKNNIDLSVINQNKFNIFMYGDNLFHSLFLFDIKFEDKALAKEFAKILIKGALASGADINQKAKGGRPPLVSALSAKNMDLVNLLIENGADASTTTDKGSTLLMEAAFKKNNIDVLKGLIEKGIDVNAKDNEGKTALMYAVDRGNSMGGDRDSHNLEDIKYLIEKGADINATDKEGKTALFYSVKKTEKIEELEFLVQNGLDINAKDNKGRTALIYITEDKYPSREAITWLLAKGADVNAKDNDGKTALMNAVMQLNDNAIQKLIKAGANVNLVDNKGRNALMYYTFHSKNTYSTYILRSLVKDGADVNIKDNDGLTPLMHLAKSKAQISKQEINYLLDAGADINATDNNNKSAKDYIKETSYCKTNVEECKKIIEQDVSVQEIKTKKHPPAMARVKSLDPLSPKKGNDVRIRGFVKDQ